MWLISKTGFVSVVAHDSEPDVLRVRGRRRDHVAAVAGPDITVLDLGRSAPDYRWHANVPRETVAAFAARAALDVDYASHVKEEVAGDDDVFYQAMMGCWRALLPLQDDVSMMRTRLGQARRRGVGTFVEAPLSGWDDECPECGSASPSRHYPECSEAGR